MNHQFVLVLLPILRLSIFPICSGVIVLENSPVVKVENGLLRGVWRNSVLGKSLQVFYGIPYAQPPLDKLRYKPPVPVSNWDGILDATKVKPGCLQKKFPFGYRDPYMSKFLPAIKPSEDCLTLNVFVPKDLPEKAKVIVWIYGGGFSRGSADTPIYNPFTLATEQKVIIVNFNYRLASFGFLYLDHPEAPGNCGLMDQVMALQWVKTNIEAFGGDSESITIAGHSAGSSSVGYHLILPESRGLFKRVIMQSGAPHSSFAMERRSVMLNNAAELASNVGCPNDPNKVKDMINCFRKTNAHELLENEPQLGYDHVYIFRPVVDGKFLPDHPLRMLQNKNLTQPADLLIGTVKDESSMFLLSFYPLIFQFRSGLKTNIADLYHITSDFFGMAGVTTEVAQALYENPATKNDPLSPRNITLKISSDSSFECPSSDVEEAYASGSNKVFKYYFTHRQAGLNIPDWMGTHHGHELIYTFGEALDPRYDCTDEERAFSKRLMTYWGNFAKTGNPNNEETDVEWPEFTKKNQEYFILAPGSTAVGHFFKAKKCLFWKNIIPKLIKMQKPTEGVRVLADFSRSDI